MLLDDEAPAPGRGDLGRPARFGGFLEIALRAIGRKLLIFGHGAPRLDSRTDRSAITLQQSFGSRTTKNKLTSADNEPRNGTRPVELKHQFMEYCRGAAGKLEGIFEDRELTCPVALFTAASASERIAFHTLNRETGHRVRRQFIDGETGKPVPNDEQVKGYEVAKGEYVVLEPEEVAAAIPESDKTISVDSFIKCGEIDDTYFDRPYYLAPTTPVAAEAFALLREGMRGKKVAALATATLFRRVRTLLIRTNGRGLIASTLRFDYEVRSAKDAFGGIPQMKIQGEMRDLAKHIIRTKQGEFDPRKFDDRYEAAVAELVKAKLEGKRIEPRKAVPSSKVVNLMDALRQSAGATAKKAAAGGKADGKAAASRNSKRAVAKTRAATKTGPSRKAG